MQRICLLLITLFGLCVFSVAAQDVVAPVAVDFRVDENGAATFAVPIHLPTGRGDMRPQVGLGYSSHNSNDGPLGVGWSLQASSAITRCRKTPFDDGEVSTVTLTSSDRFCLDGQRLHLVSGTYGAAGSLYRLNGQPGTVITAHGGSVANGPDYFKRVTKAKEVTYFGDALYSSDAAALVKPGNNQVVSA